MPIHDWRKVDAGIFHHFHGAWIFELAKRLNLGVLPADYYALGEQVTGDAGPDVLTLQSRVENGEAPAKTNSGGVATVTVSPPRVRLVQPFKEDAYARKRKTLAIHHRSNDRVIALIEILSPGNKASSAEMRRFLDKVVAALNQGIHLLIIDLFPPTRRDPQGIHGAIMAEWDSQPYEQPADKPLTLVAYSAGPAKVAYVEPVTVGEVLPQMPLFLTPETYVDAPLEEAYRDAYSGVPGRWREVLET